MERTIIYKADNFINGREISAGFFLTFAQAKQALEYKNETDHADGNYGLITEFFIDTNELSNSGTDNNKKMQELLDKHNEPKFSYFI